MKCYDDLSNNEKEKLGAYLQYRNLTWLQFTKNISVAFYILIFNAIIFSTFFMCGIILVLTRNFGSYGIELIEISLVLAVMSMSTSLLLILFNIYSSEHGDKQAYLIFGYHKMNQVFDIKKSDIKKLKSGWKEAK